MSAYAKYQPDFPDFQSSFNCTYISQHEIHIPAHSTKYVSSTQERQDPAARAIRRQISEGHRQCTPRVGW